jgi:hypothetical protein
MSGDITNEGGAEQGGPLPAHRSFEGVDPFSIAGIPAENSVAFGLRYFRKVWADKVDREKETVFVDVYPAGVEISTGKCPLSPPPEGTLRGGIQGFSDEAKRRLKRAFMTLHVPGYSLKAVTLTTHRVMTKEEYQAARKRFAEAIKYRDWAAIARLEKQRRGARHSHLALWVPPSVTDRQIRDLWLESTGEGSDPHARKHAVLVRSLTQDEAGWVIYMAKHDSKEAEAQMVFGEKHWTIWGQKTFQERDADKFTLSAEQHTKLLRVLRRHQIALRRKDVEKLRRAYQTALKTEQDRIFELPQAADFTPTGFGTWWVWDAEGRQLGECTDCIRDGSFGVETLARPEFDAWHRLRRNNVKPLHKGDLLRLLPRDVVLRAIRGIVSGEICSPRCEGVGVHVGTCPGFGGAVYSTAARKVPEGARTHARV